MKYILYRGDKFKLSYDLDDTVQSVKLSVKVIDAVYGPFEATKTLTNFAFEIDTTPFIAGTGFYAVSVDGQTFETGQFELKPGITDKDYDNRTYAQRMLEVYEKVCQALAEDPNQIYVIDGVGSWTKLDLKIAQQQRQHWKAMTLAEEGMYSTYGTVSIR